MYLTTFDWIIVAVVMGGISLFAWRSKKYARSVADFLAANRCGGRYMMTVANGMSTLAVVSAVASFEMYYNSGFSGLWWPLAYTPLSLIFAMFGYVIYR